MDATRLENYQLNWIISPKSRGGIKDYLKLETTTYGLNSLYRNKLIPPFMTDYIGYINPYGIGLKPPVFQNFKLLHVSCPYSALQPIVSFVTSAMATFDQNNGTTKKLTGKLGMGHVQETSRNYTIMKIMQMFNLSFLSLQNFFIVCQSLNPGGTYFPNWGLCLGGKSYCTVIEGNSAGLRKFPFHQHVCGEIVSGCSSLTTFINNTCSRYYRKNQEI